MTKLSVRAGTISESWVQRLLQAHVDTEGLGWVLHLSSNGPADLVILHDDGSWELIEVKSSRRRSRARRAPLTDDELALLRDVGPGRYRVVRVHRSGRDCELLGSDHGLPREQSPGAPARARGRA